MGNNKLDFLYLVQAWVLGQNLDGYEAAHTCSVALLVTDGDLGAGTDDMYTRAIDFVRWQRRLSAAEDLAG
jgi:hypothetical protein